MNRALTYFPRLFLLAAVVRPRLHAGVQTLLRKDVQSCNHVKLRTKLSTANVVALHLPPERECGVAALKITRKRILRVGVKGDGTGFTYALEFDNERQAYRDFRDPPRGSGIRSRPAQLIILGTVRPSLRK